MRAAWVVTAAIVAAPLVARGQSDDVAAAIKLVTDKPASMDTATWKEKRRDAAKKLAASGDKRAVPVLMKLAETETFDIIGELAIDGLGQLGDAQAVPLLQRIEADPSRDRGQRDKARAALAKLGAKPSEGAAPEQGATAEPGTSTATPATTTAAASGTTVPSVYLGNTLGAGGGPIPDGPAFADDLLASVERITFAVGGAQLGYDSIRKQTSFDADLAGSYERRIDREKLAYGYEGTAHVLAGYLNPDGPASSRGAQLELDARGDVRSYFGPGAYVTAILEGTHQTQYVNDVADNGTATRDVRFATEAQLGLGVGYGRVLDVGSLVRVRRISAVLEANRALGRAIDPQTARRLQSAWWALRGTRSLHPVLVATVAILRESGVLLGEPDAGLTYQLLEVLRDGQLDDRLEGVDVSLVFGEGYLSREDQPMIDRGRVEQILLQAAYAKQLPGDTADVSATAFAKLRVFTDMNAPSPYAAGATGRWRRFFYDEFADPTGSLDLGVTLGLSSDDRMGSTTGWLVGGDVGWTFRPNRASWLRVGADAKLDGGQVFFGATLEARYGLVTGSFARM
jgi:hypothetical protein